MTFVHAFGTPERDICSHLKVRQGVNGDTDSDTASSSTSTLYGSEKSVVIGYKSSEFAQVVRLKTEG